MSEFKWVILFNRECRQTDRQTDSTFICNDSLSSSGFRGLKFFFVCMFGFACVLYHHCYCYYCRRFRDLKSEYDALDCIVLGVSADGEGSHKDFIADLGLNFSLLADTNK